jgi:hypothetical protein
VAGSAARSQAHRANCTHFTAKKERSFRERPGVGELPALASSSISTSRVVRCFRSLVILSSTAPVELVQSSKKLFLPWACRSNGWHLVS